MLEYVEHRPLSNSCIHGLAVGKALAEVHGQTFESCGAVGDATNMTEPWSDFPNMIEQYIRMHAEQNQHFQSLFHRTADIIWSQRSRMEVECRRAVLLHGDFKASNLHWADDDRLLVLDWEFAYAGPAIMDVGQLMRWGCPEPFQSEFESAYRRAGGLLCDEWFQMAKLFDLVNLTGLLAKAKTDSIQSQECKQQIDSVLQSFA